MKKQKILAFIPVYNEEKRIGNILEKFPENVVDAEPKISIEQRSDDELTTFAKIQIAPDGVNVYNPAFGVTNAENITAIITEKNKIEKPDMEKITKYFVSIVRRYEILFS
jgi:translation initiation factor 2B subunit (eIF-2B alpha/beta/delta family)